MRVALRPFTVRDVERYLVLLARIWRVLPFLVLWRSFPRSASCSHCRSALRKPPPRPPCRSRLLCTPRRPETSPRTPRHCSRSVEDDEATAEVAVVGRAAASLSRGPPPPPSEDEVASPSRGPPSSVRRARRGRSRSTLPPPPSHRCFFTRPQGRCCRSALGQAACREEGESG
ncbi:hypothetical protein DAI22_05g194350 [Oryza sativa Japonica Group]|nr:hypothetical protein DAI22_05g194350 [Oryza sativa Japonica Group]